MGLGRYRFGEVLSTSFFGPRYKVACDPTTNRLSEPPIRFTDPPGRISELPMSHETEGVQASSLRPRADLPLALRLVEADAPSLIELLARSVQAVRDLDHRAILRPLQIVRSSTRLGVVTPHIEGLTLAQLLEDVSMRQVSIPPAMVLRIASDVLEGLEAMRVHATGARKQDWVFGGITPDSIHIGADGQTRLLDPGLAGSAARQPCWSHEAAALAYTAPEQTGADATFDASSDIFSLGVILWELLTGRPLFGAATAAQTLESLHRSPIPRVQRHHFVRGEPIAFSLAQAVAQALRRKPAQRFTNYDAFASALTQSGEVAPPSEVAELVAQALSHESVDELRARLSRNPESSSSSTSQRISRVSSTEPVPSPLRAASTSPLSTAAVIAAQRRLSTTPMQTPAPLHASLRAPLDELPAGVRTLRRPASLLPDHLVHKLSAFPVGDLLRRSGQRHARGVWPIALAAAAVLSFGAWSLLPGSDKHERRAAAPLVPPPVHAATQPTARDTRPALTSNANGATDEPPGTPPAEEALPSPPPVAAPEPVEVLAASATANVRPVPPMAASVPAPRRAAAVSSKRKRAAPSLAEKPQRDSAPPPKAPARATAPATGAQPKFIPDDI